MISSHEKELNVQYSGKLAIQQRVLPSYRTPFFDMLAGKCPGGLSLAAGKPRQDEGIASVDYLGVGQYQPIENIHLFRGQYYLFWQKGLIQWLNSVEPDALIMEANPRNLSTRSALSWMKSRSKPVIGWGLGSSPSDGILTNLRNTARLNFLLQFNAILTYSQQGSEQYQSLGFPQEKIFVAHNAVAPRPTHSPIQRPTDSQEPPCLLFVGRLQERKRLDLLIEACSKLPENLQPRLVIVGGGPERKSLQKLAEKNYPSAQFVGAVHGPNLEPYFRSADLFVLPGTGGLAIQQAMGWSLPIITAQGDGTQQDLVRQENGWQVPPEDLPSLLATLHKALSDIPSLRAMGSESYRIVSEEINLEMMVSSFITTLNTVSI